jgi:hypothetical protein
MISLNGSLTFVLQLYYGEEQGLYILDSDADDFVYGLVMIDGDRVCICMPTLIVRSQTPANVF